MFHQKGLSLIELMIALVLGSLLTIAATQLFLVGRQTDNLQTGIAAVQDNGRFAFDYVSRSLMEAGMGIDEPIVPFALDGEGQFNSSDAEIADGDKFDTVVYEVVGGKDCLGNDLTGYKRFYVNDDADGKRLMCGSYEHSDTDADGNTVDTWTPDDSGTLIDNVESFQVLYGLDFDTADNAGYGAADVYTNATQLKALKDDVDKGNVRIVSVRFSVLLASDEKVTLDPELAPEAIDVLDQRYIQGDVTEGNTINFRDGRLYRTYGSTVAIRNLIGGL
ncbi:MAG: hypothetical protein CMK89_22475 [Pseudomonadales bacterium]|nr:hypothetical protein [Pseudomonadales bacterium]